MEFVNNDSRLLLVATSHRNITSISNTLVESRTTKLRVVFNASAKSMSGFSSNNNAS